MQNQRHFRRLFCSVLSGMHPIGVLSHAFLLWCHDPEIWQESATLYPLHVLLLIDWQVLVGKAI